MAPDVVLVQPLVGSMDWVRNRPTLPLGLLSATALVAQNYSVKLIDQRLDPRWREHLGQELKRGPLLVGTTAMTGPQIASALEASAIVKQDSEVPVVWGGIHASLMPEQTAVHPWVDAVVVGEGERTFLDLVKAVEAGRPLDEVGGICYKDCGGVRRNPPPPFLNVDELPPVPYHLVEVKRYLPDYMGRKTIFMQTSRGCPFNCTYCYNTVYNARRWRAWTPERILEEMQRVTEFGAESVYFVDDEFCIDLKRVEAMARRILQEKLDITWQDQGVTFMSLKRMSDDYLRLLIRSGCCRLTFGAESGSQRILDMIKVTASGQRMQTVEDIVAANHRLSKFEVIPFYSFISGFPTETDEDLRATIHLLLRLLKENPRARTSPIYNFTPFPGTEMYNLAIANGFVPPSRLEEWASYGYHTTHLPWHTPARRRMLENLYFASIFLDRKFDEYGGSVAFRALADLYRPLASLRVKHQFLGLMLERHFADRVVRA